ncbi:MAG: CvpA family protein [Christensenellaceae bacterium]|nr:CvpA family protein [Christensenellaceae bacterium]
MIADAVICLIVIINLFIGYKKGLLGAALKTTSTIASGVLAVLTAGYVAEIIEDTFHVKEKLNVGIDKNVVLTGLTMIGLFVVFRFAFLILDKIIRALKIKSKAVNFLDQTLGIVFGFVLAGIYIFGLFFAVDIVSGFVEDLPSKLYLTKESGSIIAYRIYDFAKDTIFPFVNGVFGEFVENITEGV